MVKHDNDHVGSPGSDGDLPEDLAVLFERERRHLDEVDRQSVDLDVEASRQELSRRIQSDTLHRFARNRLIIRILSAVSTIEAIALAALLLGSPPSTEQLSTTANTIAVSQGEIAHDDKRTNTVRVLGPSLPEPSTPDDVGPPASDQPQSPPTHPPSLPMEHPTKPAATNGVGPSAPSRTTPPPPRKCPKEVTSGVKPDPCSVVPVSEPVRSIVPHSAEDRKPPVKARTRQVPKQPMEAPSEVSDFPPPVCSKCRHTTAWDFSSKSTCAQCGTIGEGFEQLLKARG